MSRLHGNLRIFSLSSDLFKNNGMAKHSELKHKNILSSIASKDLSAENIDGLITLIKENRSYEKEDLYKLLLENTERFPGLEAFNKEIDTILAIKESFDLKRKLISENFESPQDELIHTMWLFEHLQRHLVAFPVWEKLDIRMETNFSDKENYKSAYDALASHDYFLSYFSIVLKSLLSKTNVSSAKLSKEKLHAASQHITLAPQWNIFHEQCLFWEHGCTSVSSSGSDILFDSSNSPLINAFRVSLSRLRKFRVSRQADKFDQLILNKIKSCTYRLPPQEFRSEDELKSAYLTSLQFYSSDLSEVIQGAQLCEWLRAYTLLQEEALHYISSTGSIEHPDEILLRKNKEYFLNLMQAGGIGKQSAKCIVGHLIFHKKSQDILDTPLISIGADLVLMPTVTALINPAFSIESLLKSIEGKNNHSLSIIGPGLERSLKQDLAKAGIKHARVERKKRERRNTEKREADIVFVLDSVLFLCECKSKYQADDFISYSSLENFLRKDAVEQHLKTCDFFKENLHFVRHALGLSVDWQPTRIVRLIVTSAKLGRVMLENNIFFLDENMFHAFFSRKMPQLRKNGKVIKTFHDSRLVGPITVGAFLSYITSPPTIVEHNAYKEEREFLFPMSFGNVIFRDVECYGEVQIR